MTHFLEPRFHQTPFPPLLRRIPKSPPPISIQCRGGGGGARDLQSRLDSINNTQKLTEAMKLVAAAKVRRAQEAVINSRPFAQSLAQFLHFITQQIQPHEIDFPFLNPAPVGKVALVVFTGDRGLCGGFNASVIKKADTRLAELKNLDLGHILISVGKKGNSHFRRRSDVQVDKYITGCGGGSVPTAKEAQTIADIVFSLFISEEVDKVELIYTKFVSLLKCEPVIETLLPLLGDGEAMGDGGFRLTTKEGKLKVEREGKRGNLEEIPALLEFEQDPVQILDGMIALYLNSQILRALQESMASEVAARMNAMSNASENALELKNSVLVAYNRERQAKITGEILEIVAGAEALQGF
ncbi:ATP synthase gamma chain 1, chloroplastic-like [Cucurbita pepo subsp. pepo]|uniref:ATP synthase gamma chain 1, chloroplastic-like n=1 Tax=Cucurbita pepo subsp. pepo TaxID=3664 RepID=UPI000C9D9329|nr:ATP synthase gamma chain 1, chloroplastic-like [Cucurbita pepo subsp. pepo]